MEHDVVPLGAFWDALETNFPLAGVRRALNDLLGHPLLVALERAGLFRFQRESRTYPCPKPGGHACPRHVRRRRDGRIVAICGNHPPECDDVPLSETEIEWVGLVPEQLTAALRDSLLFGGTDTLEADIPHVYRAGTYIPTPGIRHTIYFAVRCSGEDYATVFDALRSRHEGQSFAVLVPTDRFLWAETVRQMDNLGVPVLPLAGVVELDQSGRLVSAVDPEQLFGRIGRRAIEVDGAPAADHAWLRTNTEGRLISEREYKELAASASQYMIFADQITQTIEKGKGNARTRRTNVPLAYFAILRRAIETRGYFDPTNADHVDRDTSSGKQIFQRARQAVDICRRGQGRRSWALFKTVKADRRAVYHFQPDPDVRFAVIFAPQLSRQR